MALGFVEGGEVGGECGAGLDGDDRAVVLPDALEEVVDEAASLGGVGLGLPEAREVGEQRFGAVDVGAGGWREALKLFLQRLAAHGVAGLGEVAEDVEVLQAVELGVQVAAARGVLAGLALGCVLDGVGDEPAQLGVGLECGEPRDELTLDWFGFDDRLLAVAVVAAGGALVAADACARAAGAVHTCAAPLAVQELAEQVLLGGSSGLEHAGAPRADLLHAVEQLLGDDRLVQAADRAALIAQPRDVAGVGGVAEHLPHGVLAERPVACAACAFGVEPFGERAV
ncbi:MAG TPA: hypothetical protein VID29_11155 [Solirubrobacteraceae bacterium]